MPREMAVEVLSSCDFRFYLVTRHPCISLKLFLGVDGILTYGSIIREIGSRYLIRFLEHEANADLFLRELEASKVPELVEEAVSKWPKAASSGIGLTKATLLYLACRLIKPRVVVETGVASGVSTAFILAALNCNSFGTLYSIDLPSVEEDSKIPEGLSPGWVIPSHLRTRWVSRLGDARCELPKVLESVGEVDMFLHDSLHTYDHMSWEYKTAWPYIARGGVLASDDALANAAFTDFTRHARVKRTIIATLGIARKP